MLAQVFVLQQVLLSHVSENFLPTKGSTSKGGVVKLLSGQVPGIGSQSTQNIILLWLTGNCGATLAVKLSLRRKVQSKNISNPKLNFKLFFLTDVSNYCEERKIKLSVNVYIKIARNLGSNFWNFGSNFLLLFSWHGPYTIVGQTSPVSYVLRAADNRRIATTVHFPYEALCWSRFKAYSLSSQRHWRVLLIRERTPYRQVRPRPVYNSYHLSFPK